jgi:uncharacterized protein YfiM (DUF2279 family)
MGVKVSGRKPRGDIFRPVLSGRVLTIGYAFAALAVSTPAAAQDRTGQADHWLGPDKPVHALAAGWTAGAGYAAGIELEWRPADRRRAAITAGLAASLGKEALDWTRGRQFSFKDLAADLAGIAAFVALTAALDSR